MASQINSKSGDFSCRVDELSLTIQPQEIIAGKINPYLFNKASKKNKLASKSDHSMLTLIGLLKKKGQQNWED